MSTPSDDYHMLDSTIMWEDSRGELDSGRARFADAMAIARSLAPRCYRVVVMRNGVVIWSSHGKA